MTSDVMERLAMENLDFGQLGSGFKNDENEKPEERTDKDGSPFLVIDRADVVQSELEEIRQSTTQQIQELRKEVDKLWYTLRCYAVVTLPVLIGWTLFILSKLTHSKTVELYVTIINFGIVVGILLYDVPSLYRVLQTIGQDIQERAMELLNEYYRELAGTDVIRQDAGDSAAPEDISAEINDQAGSDEHFELRHRNYSNVIEPLEVD